MSEVRTGDIIELAGRIGEEVLFPTALETDAADIVPKERLDLLADAGFYGLSSSKDAGGLDLERETGEQVIEVLAGACLTTTFVWMQHLGTAAVLSRLDGPLGDEWGPLLASGRRRAGIAFSHLRHPDPPMLVAAPVAGGYSVDGVAPLVTGWGAIDVVHVAARKDKDIVWLLVDAVASPTLVAKRLELAAVNASATVALRFSGHVVPAARVTVIESLEEWLRRDALGLRTNGFLSLGVAHRCLALLGDGSLEPRIDALRDELWTASPSEMPEVRARASLFALEAAASLIAAGGGRSMVREAHAQRLGREALFLLVQGQTQAIRAAQLRQLNGTSG